jgi:hypothetical protein
MQRRYEISDEAAFHTSWDWVDAESHDREPRAATSIEQKKYLKRQCG